MGKDWVGAVGGASSPWPKLRQTPIRSEFLIMSRVNWSSNLNFEARSLSETAQEFQIDVRPQFESPGIPSGPLIVMTSCGVAEGHPSRRRRGLVDFWTELLQCHVTRIFSVEGPRILFFCVLRCL